MANNAIQTTPAPASSLPVAPAPETKSPLRRPRWYQALTALASLRLTVVLFALSILLVFFGTLAQIDMSTFSAVQRYFRCWYVWVPLQLLFPRTLQLPHAVGFPFPGGYIIGGLLLINLLAAHGLRFRFRWADLLVLPLFVVAYVVFWYWQNNPSHLLLAVACLLMTAFVVAVFPLHGKRAGIILLHLGIIMLLVGELITALAAVEQHMTIVVGETVNFTDIQNEGVVLDFITAESPGEDGVVSIPGRLLREGKIIQHPALPVDVQVVEYMANSELIKIPADQPYDREFATSSMGDKIAAKPRPISTGVSQNQHDDAPTVRVALLKKGTKEVVGRFLLSLWFYPNFVKKVLPLFSVAPQDVQVDGKRYFLEVRYPRSYKPYTVHLNKFDHKVYRGTNIPKDYSSWVQLVDPTHHEERAVRIWMNNPLRYRGETFYQSGMLPGDAGTILQVVRNPGWMLPYFSCAIVSVGMLAHFGLGLVGFLRRRVAP
jgi:hypothetical protein